MSSIWVTQRVAMMLTGLLYGAVLAGAVSYVWTGMGSVAFVSFVIGWAVGMTNTIALQRRHPQLIYAAGWKWIKPRYKPSKIGKDEYEITLVEFIRGRIEVIIIGVPLSLFIAGLAGLLWPTERVRVFTIVFGTWALLIVLSTMKAISRTASPE